MPVRAPARITPDDERWPSQLQDLSRPPLGLWWIGNWNVLHEPIVAIVGTRRATRYGERITRELALALARGGACIVSGLALGIDGVAHRAALDVGGRTVAVLGTGVDIAYPRSHRHMYDEIAERGLLLSELEVGEHSHGGSFPKRNRIIAALASVVIVVEAGPKSGTTHTVDAALQTARTLAAVPGPIDVPQSAYSNELIRDGAHPITSVADALALTGLTPPALGGTEPADEVQRAIWSVLRHGPMDMDSLTAAAGVPARECLAAVSGLEMLGIVDCELTGQIRLR